MKTPEYLGQDIFTRVTTFKSPRIGNKKIMMKQNNPNEEVKLEFKKPVHQGYGASSWHF
jgi:hypothetical protein